MSWKKRQAMLGWRKRVRVAATEPYKLSFLGINGERYELVSITIKHGDEPELSLELPPVIARGVALQMLDMTNLTYTELRKDVLGVTKSDKKKGNNTCV